MSRIKKHNLYSIKGRFQSKTGIWLSPAKKNTTVSQRRFRKLALIAAIMAVFVGLTAFGVSVFSTRSGDSLTITASYYGSGIVWVEVTNQSDKDLELEPEMNLYYYSTQELVETTGRGPYISKLTVGAHSTERIRLDLRKTYDIGTLENSKNDFYYLELTNDGFLTGQKWSCMVSFVVSDYVTPWYTLTDARCLEGVLPSLKAYYQNFTPDIFARWPDAFSYLELVEEELAKVDGNIVKACDPPIYTDYCDWFGSTHWSSFDGYNKLMGRDEHEYYDQIGVDLPCIQDDGTYGGGWVLPLFYLYQYNKADIKSPQDYAFVRGHLLTFAEMEPYKVYDDGEYVIYEMHHLFYTDLETYVEDMLLQRDDVYLNGEIWTRIRNFYNHWSQKNVMEQSFYNAFNPGTHKKEKYLTIPDVIRIAQKGEQVSFADLQGYWGNVSGINISEARTGGTYTIDGNYELFYAMHLDGTLRGWYLIHKPSGDKIDIRYEDVTAFVESHGKPLPRCECKDT